MAGPNSGPRLLVLLTTIITAAANFNLFVSKAEVKRLLGLYAELYYVREGVVNEYAMGWTVKVSPDIHFISFNWEALTKRPVLYNMAVWINTSSLVAGAANPLLDPSVNVSLSGVIPKSPSSFQLILPCTGLASGEVEVILNLNVTASRADQKPTVLYFSRKKICLEGVAAESFLPQRGGGNESPTAGDGANEQDTWLPAFTYVITGVTSLILVVGVIAAVAYWRCRHHVTKRNKCTFPSRHSPLFIRASNQCEVKPAAQNKSHMGQLDTSYTSPATGGTYTAPSVGDSYASVYKFPFASTELTLGGARCQCPDSSCSGMHCQYPSSTCSGLYESSCYSGSNCNSVTNNNRSASDSRESNETNSEGNGRISLRLLTDTRSDSNPERPHVSISSPSLSTLKEKFKQLQMDRERVRLTEVVQEGRRGRVYKGWLQREHPELDQPVWIKTVKEGSPPEDVENLCQEATLLLGLRHQNLLNLVGMSFVSCTPPFLIFPDPQGVNLRIYLQTGRSLKVAELVEIYLQAASGLHFMHTRSVAHTDVAARNCVLSDNLHVRLMDAALTRDFFPDEYEGRGTKNKKPVRWMAPELLQQAENGTAASSSASDMWSFGVLLWELTTHGELPFYGIPYQHVYSSLLTGLRLRQVFSCPDELYQLMSECWNILPEGRPTAQRAADFIASFRNSLQSFV